MTIEERKETIKRLKELGLSEKDIFDLMKIKDTVTIIITK